MTTPIEALAAALHVSHETHFFSGKDDATIAGVLLAALSSSGWSLVRTEGLEAAWAEAEAGLPEGWKLLVGRETVTPYSYWATASGPFDDELRTFPIVSSSQAGKLEKSPADALTALAAALRP